MLAPRRDRIKNAAEEFRPRSRRGGKERHSGVDEGGLPVRPEGGAQVGKIDRGEIADAEFGRSVAEVDLHIARGLYLRWSATETQ